MAQQCPKCFDHFGEAMTTQQVIVHLLGHGMTQEAIGNALGITAQGVGGYIKRYDLKRVRQDLIVNPETRDILAESGRL